MVRKTKALQLTPEDIEILRSEGKTVRQIGHMYGIDHSSVVKRAKQVNTERLKSMMDLKAVAPGEKSMAIKRLNRMGDTVEKELRYTISRMEECDGTVKNNEVGCPHCQQTFEVGTVDRAGMKDRIAWQNQALKQLAELRAQLSLAKELMQAMYDIQQLEEFKRVTLEEIGCVSAETRDNILKRLKQRRSLERASTVG